MRKNLLPFAFILASIFASCERPNEANRAVHQLYENLTAQKKYFYEVEYAEGIVNEEPLFKLFGTGKLTRNYYGSLSGFYFGFSEAEKNNHLQLIRNEGETVGSLTSLTMDDAGIDVVSDSLQSAILLNPEWLMSFLEQAQSISIGQTALGNRLEFEFPDKKRKIQLISSKHHKELLHLAIWSKLPDGKPYCRQWNFNYLERESFQEQLAIYQKQLHEEQKPFL